ncbi:MAG TPA: carboxypeptidase regulatory-like domain-containing protein, partial [Puia sp.]|nr:carboxypeptidase regulatory-like domain-containing protein [Puia sp.]
MLEKRIKWKGTKPILELLTLLLLSAHLFAQTAQKEIKGRVTDATSGQPVASATIAIKGSRNAVTSGSDGEFTITV